MTVTEMPPDVAEEVAPKGKKGKKAKKEKGGKSNLVPALVLAAGIAVGGYFMGGSGGGAEAATATTVEPEIVEGALLALEPLTVNLADGHYLRVGVAFQMSEDYVDAVEGEEGEAFAHHDASKVQDTMISMFGGHDAAALSSTEGRDEAKHALHEAANEMLDDTVMDVYFTEFVIQ